MEEVLIDDIVYNVYEVTATICSRKDDFNNRTAKLNCAKRFGTERAYKVNYPEGTLMKDIVFLEFHKIEQDIWEDRSIFDPYKRIRRL